MLTIALLALAFLWWHIISYWPRRVLTDVIQAIVSFSTATLAVYLFLSLIEWLCS